MNKPIAAILVCSGTLAAALAALPLPPSPPENLPTPAKRVLGKILFWDEQLSSDGTVACGTCHIPGSGGADPRIGLNPGPDRLFFTPDDINGSPGVARTGVLGEPIVDPLFGTMPRVTPREAPVFIGAAYAPLLFHDGRASATFVDPETGLVGIPQGGALESQAVAPILNDVEMAREGRTWDDVRERLSSVIPLDDATDLPPDVSSALATGSRYPELFQAAFGTPAITAERIAFAIATYERTLVAGQAPWDSFVAGNVNALTPRQQQGWNLFQNVGCALCHTPPLFTNHSFHNIGIRPPGEDLGRQEVTGQIADRGRFKVPTLRNSGLKATFMHNGRLATMLDAVAWYRPVNPDRFPDNLDPALPLSFTPQDADAMTDFVTNGLVDPRVRAEAFPFDRPAIHGGAAPVLAFLPDGETLAWPVLAGVASYGIYRGSLSDLADADADGLPDAGFGDCMAAMDADATDGSFLDPDLPPPGGGFFYLKSVVDGSGSERALGATSAGLPRVPAVPCP